MDGPLRIPVTEPAGQRALNPSECLLLPPGDPRRTEFLLALAQRFVASMSSGDPARIAANLEPDVRLYILQDDSGNLWGGDFEAVYETPEGVMRAFALWAEPWEDLTLELEELYDLGETKFIVHGAWHGRGRGSGVEVSTPYSARYTLRGERIARIEFVDLDATLRDLGLTR
jgi:ketosteroid isomerase-like protein